MKKQRVLFVCNHNAGRSQMAQALLNTFYGDRYEAESAGFSPSDTMNCHTIAVMEEMGIDLSEQQSKPLLAVEDGEYSRIVVMCETDAVKLACLPRADTISECTFADPYFFAGSEDEILDGFRAVRDEIRAFLETEFGAKPKKLEIVLHSQEENGMQMPFFCSDTLRPVGDVAEEMGRMVAEHGWELSFQRVAAEAGEPPLLLLLNNMPLEEFVPLPNPDKYCGMSCSDCAGSGCGPGTGSGGCRRYESLPESVFRLAILKACGLK
jgi:arsenate reductase